VHKKCELFEDRRNSAAEKYDDTGRNFALASKSWMRNKIRVSQAPFLFY